MTELQMLVEAKRLAKLDKCFVSERGNVYTLMREGENRPIFLWCGLGIPRLLAAVRRYCKGAVKRVGASHHD